MMSELNNIFLSFLKKYNIYFEDVFKYYQENKVLIEKKDFNNGFVGCYPKIENGILKKVKIIVPRIESFIDISINIHEYVHMIRLYSSLNKKIVFTEYEEVLPMFYEFLFLYNTFNEECTMYLANYRNCILKSENKDNIRILNICNELLFEYNNDSIDSLEQKVKKRYK